MQELRILNVKRWQSSVDDALRNAQETMVFTASESFDLMHIKVQIKLILKKFSQEEIFHSIGQ